MKDFETEMKKLSKFLGEKMEAIKELKEKLPTSKSELE